ncbi:hypothetical protein N7492_009849 [Penicillium capsulatum]|uniref:Uncharacterized protein n=1 Tax=Penicillium capsulatum TaxID=69766 RepID=A0A9W9LEE8_9EURO|nr:hypothetical protein N7492_009849 [Penicillium capsulatum]KAJ6112360.1 hypothetical protein N7512_007684 [Penicillium capsulatum]
MLGITDWYVDEGPHRRSWFLPLPTGVALGQDHTTPSVSVDIQTPGSYVVADVGSAIPWLMVAGLVVDIALVVGDAPVIPVDALGLTVAPVEGLVEPLEFGVAFAEDAGFPSLWGTTFPDDETTAGVEEAPGSIAVLCVASAGVNDIMHCEKTASSGEASGSGVAASLSGPGVPIESGVELAEPTSTLVESCAREEEAPDPRLEATEPGKVLPAQRAA